MIIIKKTTGTYNTNKKYFNYYYTTNRGIFSNIFHGLYLDVLYGYYYHGGR